MKRLSSRLLLVLSCLLVACGGGGGEKPGAHAGGDGDASHDGGTDDDAGAPPPLGAGPGQLALRVDTARQATKSSRGSLYVVMTLANGTGSAPASVNPALFQVKTSTGLFVAATVDSVQWVDGANCDPTISVADGASHSCVLEFDVAGADAVALHYRTANKLAGVGSDQREAEAPITLDACTPCADECTYLDLDTDNCGKCGAHLSEDVACVAGVPSCGEVTLTPCADVNGIIQCVDLEQDQNHCGACGMPVPNGASCSNGTPACYQEGQVICGDSCVALDTTTNCGACGHACSDAAMCEVASGKQACVIHGGAVENPGSEKNLVAYKAGMTCKDVCTALHGTCSSIAPMSLEAEYGCWTINGGDYGTIDVSCDEAPPGEAMVQGHTDPCPLAQLSCTCLEP